MYLRKLLVSCFLSVPCVVFAQHPLLVSSGQLNFGNVVETAPDSLPLTFTNTSIKPISVTETRFYSYYKGMPFSTRDSVFTVPASGSKTIFIKFAPIQNMAHNSEVVFRTGTGWGSVKVDLIGQGKFSNAYYSTTENVEGEPLKTALKTRLNLGAVDLGYNTARDRMFMNIDNQKVNGQGANVNTVEDVYTSRIISGYADRTAAQNFGVNTEHTWPQSKGADVDPMRSDIHHLYVVDASANSTRSNYPFGNLTNWTWAVGGSRFNGSIFEPRDQQKGRVGRSMLYFATRYQSVSTVSIAFLASQESTMRLWNDQFPPNTVDKKRNDDIYGYILVRNPYVDYPQLLNRISSISGTAFVSQVRNLDLSDQSIEMGFIASGNAATYDLVLVNNGNSAVDISNLAISGSDFDFAPGFGANISIAGGESNIIRVKLLNSTGNPQSAQLTFSSNVGGTSFYTLPISANSSSSVNGSVIGRLNLKVYPNPVTEDFVVVELPENESLSALNLSIIDMHGRTLRADYLQLNNQLLLDTRTLASGVYLIQLNVGSAKNYVARIVK